MSLRRAGRDDLAAVRSGERPEIDDIIGMLDRFFVVLDDENRVAEIAKLCSVSSSF